MSSGKYGLRKLWKRFACTGCGKTLRAGLAAIKPILEETIDVLINKQLSEIFFQTLWDGFVDIYKNDAETAENVLRLFFNGKLKKFECYTRKKD